MKEKIMIVDDEPDVVDSLKTVLKAHEYEVIIATNGIECLERLKRGFKGVILLDLMMPVMDGWDTLRQIIEQGYMKDVAIEIISALGTRENKRMGTLEPYIYDYLTKPLDMKDLIESVKKCNAYLFAKVHESNF